MFRGNVSLLHSARFTVDQLWTLISRKPAGDRTALAQAITLVESTLPKDNRNAHILMSKVLNSRRQGNTMTTDHNKNLTEQKAPLNPAFRIGLTGPPGVGKSTFIEAFGMLLVKKGHRVAVLAVDPSSSMTGGSILGDKTRMYELSRHAAAYVRPSPSCGSIGGVARNTAEAILLCESAGYDVVLVETVGVGQSETMVSDLVDLFVLLVQPGGGDELQGIKKGIVELADMILINKADGDLKVAAQMSQLEYVSALKLLRPKLANWRPPVLPVSSVENNGIDKAWSSMMDFYQTMRGRSGDFDNRRRKQRKLWMWRQVSDTMLTKLKQSESVAHEIEKLERLVADGRMTPGQAAEQIFERGFIKFR